MIAAHVAILLALSVIIRFDYGLPTYLLQIAGCLGSIYLSPLLPHSSHKVLHLLSHIIIPRLS